MKHFYIYPNTIKDPNLTNTKRIKEYLVNKGQKVSCRELDNNEKISFEDVDIMLVLGGDGTVLQAAREFITKRIPLIGINFGTLGYMTEIEQDNLEESLDRLIDGEYELESRMMIKGMITYGKDGSNLEDIALNDIVIARYGSIQVVEFDVFVNGQFLKHYAGDGVIITTPTGSTGYNLSAMGPIVEPNARLIMLTPICTHSFNQRSIIFSKDDAIEIAITKGGRGAEQRVDVIFDGTHIEALKPGDRVGITTSDKNISFVCLSQKSFMEKLHRKMAD
ncbi:MAG: NAD(+)/NADH kinase [Lachnospiraceae bacterium]|nr:NAD(+)/NADH kinase [Lachnospiraceae bacterium]